MTARLGRSGGRLAALAVLLALSCGSALPLANADAADWWRPKAGMTWRIQLNNPPAAFEPGVDAYDVDLFETPAASIAAAQARGIRIICYFSAGSAENWRPDYQRFRKKDLGKGLDGWKGERWVDVRSGKVRRIMRARLDLARDKGCDAVDPDNVDGYANDNGLGLKAKHQLKYNRFLAREAHARGLAIGLKNDVEQVPRLVKSFDFAVNEECLQYDECHRLKPFLNAGKPVLHIEYVKPTQAARVCNDPARAGFATLVKKLSLDAWEIPCQP